MKVSENKMNLESSEKHALFSFIKGLVGQKSLEYFFNDGELPANQVKSAVLEEIKATVMQISVEDLKLHEGQVQKRKVHIVPTDHGECCAGSAQTLHSDKITVYLGDPEKETVNEMPWMCERR